MWLFLQVLYIVSVPCDCLLVHTLCLLWPWTRYTPSVQHLLLLLLHGALDPDGGLSEESVRVSVWVCVWGLCCDAANNFQATGQELSSASATLSVLSVLFYNCNILIFFSWAAKSFQHSETGQIIFYGLLCFSSGFILLRINFSLSLWISDSLSVSPFHS